MFERKIWNGIQEECDGWRSITYGDLLAELVDKYSDKKAVVGEECEITYSELNIMSDNLLGYFLSLGLRKGDIVIMQVPNSIEMVVSLFGLFKGGIIPVMTLPAHGKYEIGGICEISKAKAYICMNTFCHGGCEEVAREICKDNSCVKTVIFGDDLTREMNNERELNKYEKPLYSDIAMFLLSGGTTGIPKMIPRTHGDYIYDNIMIGKRCELSDRDVFLSVLPASHNFTLGNPGILGTLYYGGTVVMTDTVSPMEILEKIETYKVTFTAMVPVVLGMCVNYRREDDVEDISSLRFVMTGGAMLPKEIEDSAEDVLGTKLLQIYGTAEGLNTCYSPSEEVSSYSGKQGVPISPYDEILILDENDNPLPFGEKGAMVTKGPYTIRAYFNNKEANDSAFTKDGYYRTGDLAVLNDRYELTIMGRVVEQINKGGEKIMPIELENCIRRHENVKDCSVFGLPDRSLGNLVVAAVITTGKNIESKELLDFLKECGVANYKLPDKIIFVPEFPLTAVGKVDKKQMLKMYFEV